MVLEQCLDCGQLILPLEQFHPTSLIEDARLAKARQDSRR